MTPRREGWTFATEIETVHEPDTELVRRLIEERIGEAGPLVWDKSFENGRWKARIYVTSEPAPLPRPGLAGGSPPPDPPRPPSRGVLLAARLLPPADREEIVLEWHDQVETVREHGRPVWRETLSILRAAVTLALRSRTRSARSIFRRS